MSAPNQARTGHTVVTGAAGFIGSALTHRLAARGQQIVGIDNERSGQWSRVEDVCVAIPRDLATMTVAELSEHLDGADVCYHLAAEKYNSSQTTPQRVIDVNITATHRLLEASARAGVRKVVFTSSLYAYGSLGPAPMKEDDLPRPTTTYGMSKVAGEHLLRVAERDHGLQWAVARLFFVYGPDQYAEGGYKSVIISNFERLLEAQAPTIFGDGRQALDYVYIDDVVGALVSLAAQEHDGLLVNIGSGTATPVEELTGAMLDTAESSLEPIFCPPDWTAGSVRVSDVSLSRSALGWEACIPLADGLEAVWRWMRMRDG